MGSAQGADWLVRDAGLHGNLLGACSTKAMTTASEDTSLARRLGETDGTLARVEDDFTAKG